MVRNTNERAERKDKEEKMKAIGNKGFTLIELLVVVAIIGILAAIAIPQFAQYRQRGYDARAQADLRNAATAEESYFVENNAYTNDSCDAGTATSPAKWGVLNVYCSRGVTAGMTAGTGSFTGTAVHVAGTRTFNYDSTQGGLTNGY